ncbi:general secretion pathway protein GspK [Sedimenticola sp.]|uniref:general secretion pathway protein GspK n=1 Tax=Sedimenticola sp. TaxID=1940285 RepID=UPI002589DB3C|nr:type II secretion system protein GspK [Sedimenticola sp.]MCW8904245.1 type II secretion system protein GspK [Sedimenticola sp.]
MEKTTSIAPGFRPMRNKCETGVALIAVLWILAILTIVVTGIAAQTRTEQRLTRNLIASEQAYHAAEGGVYHAIHQLSGDQGSSGQKLALLGSNLRIGGALVKTEITDERGKIDLNVAPDELIRGLIQAAGVELDEASRLTDAILDWRDSDSLRRLHGAEDADYRLAGLNYEAKDAEFDSVDELQRVLDMPPEIFEIVRDGFTIQTHAPDINPMMAAPLVLAAIPGMTEELVSGFIEAREASLAEGLPAPAFPLGGSPYITFENGPAYRVNARAEIPSRAVARIGAVVVADRQRGPADFSIIAWSSSPY